VKKFIRNGLIFFSPFLLWGLVVFIVDPYSYWGAINIMETNRKDDITKRNNSITHSIFKYNKYPSKNLIVGDSRSMMLSNKDNLQNIYKLSNQKFSQLGLYGGKLNEIIQMIYFANNKLKINNLFIGINFNQFNMFSYGNRIDNAISTASNPLRYIYNRSIIEIVYYIIRELITGANLKPKPPWSINSKKSAWIWHIKTKALHWYGKYKYPKKLDNQLIELDQFAKNNNIKLTFIILPHHWEFHERLIELGLQAQEKKFKKFMSGLNSRVIDFDYKNSVTINKDNFQDPIHLSEQGAKILTSEIWGNSLRIGKEL
jgi:hypothetical protein